DPEQVATLWKQEHAPVNDAWQLEAGHADREPFTPYPRQAGHLRERTGGVNDEPGTPLEDDHLPCGSEHIGRAHFL
ncbi:MAG: hypothetical protein KDC03_00825, partial [Flavobacteriales bacterium]|nr:hypothetical protein [Flavobacteriales bacterium]